ncbi:sodium channel modifier 1 [Electrophorus electricus]|uniref:Sodium channel modifier 1 n=1 Tax=Electrophorus electricus TaxID=8005 RepID=A0A4W4HA00_ELEEL|nr:sodium channel modifier 1 [Electrophorus electricus]
MSFKREGDDQSLLNVLKKRRVADLLSHFIPEDEAALMKNGRYSCLVCSHRPVFDTVDMLTVHRKGKRHLEGLNWFYGKKAQIQNEIDKRRHQDFVNKEEDREEAGSSAPLLTQTRRITHHALLRTVPYSSCHKKASERSENPAVGFSSGCRNTPVSEHTVDQSCTTTAKNINTQTTPAYSEITNSSQCQNRRQIKKKKKLSSASRPPESEPPMKQRCRELEHYLKLKSAGWLHDPSGKWVKDENVEFDSDEEDPLPLLSSSETT